jgi:hypothetical protein
VLTLAGCAAVFSSPHTSVEEALGARALPEMLFGTSLTLTHEPSGVALVFNATDALGEWKACSCASVSCERSVLGSGRV